MRTTMATLACAVTVLGACGSKKKKPAAESTSASVATGSAQVAATGSAAALPSGELVWNEAPRLAKPGKKVNHHFDAPPPEAIADPDAVIARYKAECPNGPASDACADLRRKVERILLDTIIELRSVNAPIDRQWWRVAASAQLPQLACLGVMALGRQKDRSADEDAILLAALDHAAPSVRESAVGTRLPAIEAQWSRSQQRATFAVGCLDGTTDRAYDLRWAGGYPNAKYRFFASSPSQRWFTTSDPVEKVIEHFTKAGKPPQTEQALQAQMMQKYQEEIMKITDTMKEGETEKANAAVMAAQAKLTPPKLSGVDGIGEVRYVMLTSNIGIAIFKDDVLKATSIVAIAPPSVMDVSIEGMQQKALVRQVYGF